jgi:hypothetical protein
MGDRDLPQYNPDSQGGIDDYWETSASYHAARKMRENARQAKMGAIANKQDWLRALSVSLAEDDEYIFERLGEIARNWNHDEKAQRYMLKIHGNILNLQVHW